MKKEAVNKTTSNVEDSQLIKLYMQLKDHRENGDDCKDTIQKIIDFSYNNVISEAELQRHLA
jgi:hypothetical protein